MHLSLRHYKDMLAVVLFTLPFCGFAIEKEMPVEHFGGYYAGLSLGGAISEIGINTTTNLLYPSQAFFTSSNNSAHISATNALGSVLLGYLYSVKYLVVPTYIGPEIYGSLGQPKFSTSQSANATLPTESLATTTSGQLNWGEVGVDLRLGGLATPSTLLFGRVGVAFNTVTANTTSTSSRPALPLSASVNNGSSKSCVGFRIGGGIEQKVSAKINFRADYIFTHYPSTNLSAINDGSTAAVFQLAPITNTTMIQVNTNTILASLVYQLNL